MHWLKQIAPDAVSAKLSTGLVTDTNTDMTEQL